MWTFNKLLGTNITPAGFMYVFEAINENGETTTFVHSYKEQLPEEQILLTAQNHVEYLLNGKTE